MLEDIIYFYDSSNSPMDLWDFDSIWQGNDGDYPSLRVFD